jgi:thymidylate synthase
MLELSDFAVDGSDFKVVDYNPLGAIKMPVAV